VDAITRWERIALALLVTGLLFVAFTAYSIYSGEDLAGVVMTVAPGGFVFALWYLVRARIDWLVSGHRPPLPVLIASGVVAGLGVVVVVLGLASDADQAARRPPIDGTTPAPGLQKMDLSDLEEVDQVQPDGTTIRTLARKHHPPPTDCEWKEFPNPSPDSENPGKTIRVCVPTK